MNTGLLKVCFGVAACRGLKKMFKVPASSFHIKHFRGHTSGTPFSSTTSDWGSSPRFLTRRPSRAVARCETVDWDSFMVHALLCSTKFPSCSSGIFEQRLPRTKGRQINSVACSLPWFSPLALEMDI